MGQTFSVFTLFFFFLSVFCHFSNSLTSEPSSHNASGDLFLGGPLASSVWNTHFSCFIQVYLGRRALPLPAASGMRKGISSSVSSIQFMKTLMDWGTFQCPLGGKVHTVHHWATYFTGTSSHPFYFTITSKPEGASERTEVTLLLSLCKAYLGAKPITSSPHLN